MKMRISKPNNRHWINAFNNIFGKIRENPEKYFYFLGFPLFYVSTFAS